MCGTNMCARLHLAFIIVVSVFRTTTSGILAGNNNANLYKRIRRELPGCNTAALGEDDLCFMSSDVVPGQLVMLNATEESAIIINPKDSQYGFISRDGKGIFFDEEMNLGFQAEGGNWSNAVPRSALELQIPNLIENLSPIEVSSIETNHPFYAYMKRIVCFFGSDLRNSVRTAAENLLTTIRKQFFLVIHAIKKVLGPIIDLTSHGWLVYGGGLVCFVIVLKWIAQYVAESVGGIDLLVAGAVLFPLVMIVGSKNGLQALFIMLKTVVTTFDISKVFKSITESPTKIAEFITGLGGETASGITGLFKVVSCILQLINAIVLEPLMAISQAILESLRILVNMVRDFFSYESRSQSIDEDELNNDVDDMLSLVEEQDKKFKNRGQLQTYSNFLKASKGEGEFIIYGINIGSIIQTLLNLPKSGLELVANIFNILTPVLPFSISIPNFLTNLLQTVNRNHGLEDIKEIMPDVDFGDIGSIGVSRSQYIPTDNLTTAELIKRTPIAKKIYDRIVNAVRCACGDNVTDSDLLNPEWDSTNELRNELVLLT